MAEDWPKVVSRRLTRVSPWMTVIERAVEFAPGAPVELYHAVGQQDYIAIVALTPEGRIPIVRQYRPALERFLEDPRLPIHNNSSELNLRRQAIGRKNWLFVGNEEGGHVNTLFVSLLASCAVHRIEPWAYLRDILCLLPRWPVHHVLELAPANWSTTYARDDVQAKLAANVYRQATLTQA